METTSQVPQQPEANPPRPEYRPPSPPPMQWNQDSRRKSPMLAGILSLLPGLGQVYVGYYQQGFINLLVVGGTISLLVSDLGPLTPLGGIFLAFYWLFNIIDASRRAMFYNEALVGLSPFELPEQIQTPGSHGSLVGGILMIALGAIALSHTVFHIRLDWIEDWWPLALIIVGLVLIGQSAYQKYWRG